MKRKVYFRYPINSNSLVLGSHMHNMGFFGSITLALGPGVVVCTLWGTWVQATGLAQGTAVDCLLAFSLAFLSSKLHVVLPQLFSVLLAVYLFLLELLSRIFEFHDILVDLFVACVKLLVLLLHSRKCFQVTHVRFIKLVNLQTQGLR